MRDASGHRLAMLGQACCTLSPRVTVPWLLRDRDGLEWRWLSESTSVALGVRLVPVLDLRFGQMAVDGPGGQVVEEAELR